MVRAGEPGPCQPARAVSHATQPRNHRGGSPVARSDDDFVESGPLFVVGPRFRDRILPLPESRGMGWGLEIDWHDLIRDGCRLGIVDRTPVEHLGEWAGDYDRTEPHEALVDELQTHAHPMWSGMRETVGTWRPWQQRPPWT